MNKDKLKEQLKRMYDSVDKMNIYLLKGDIENAKREWLAQKQINIKFKEIQNEE